MYLLLSCLTHWWPILRVFFLFVCYGKDKIFSYVLSFLVKLLVTVVFVLCLKFYYLNKRNKNVCGNGNANGRISVGQSKSYAIYKYFLTVCSCCKSFRFVFFLLLSANWLLNIAFYIIFAFVVALSHRFFLLFYYCRSVPRKMNALIPL